MENRKLKVCNRTNAFLPYVKSLFVYASIFLACFLKLSQTYTKTVSVQTRVNLFAVCQRYWSNLGLLHIPYWYVRLVQSGHGDSHMSADWFYHDEAKFYVSSQSRSLTANR